MGINLVNIVLKHFVFTIACMSIGNNLIFYLLISSFFRLYLFQGCEHNVWNFFAIVQYRSSNSFRFILGEEDIDRMKNVSPVPRPNECTWLNKFSKKRTQFNQCVTRSYLNLSIDFSQI